MTVKDLMKRLAQFDQDDEVFMSIDPDGNVFADAQEASVNYRGDDGKMYGPKNKPMLSPRVVVIWP
jgi:hypothetical protein